MLSVDLETTPELVWVGPEGDHVVTGSNVTVGRAETMARKTSLLLSFLPLNSTHGGNYSCEASILVPYVNVTLSIVARRMPIITSKSKSCALSDCMEAT